MSFDLLTLKNKDKVFIQIIDQFKRQDLILIESHKRFFVCTYRVFKVDYQSRKKLRGKKKREKSHISPREIN